MHSADLKKRNAAKVKHRPPLVTTPSLLRGS